MTLDDLKQLSTGQFKALGFKPEVRNILQQARTRFPARLVDADSPEQFRFVTVEEEEDARMDIQLSLKQNSQHIQDCRSTRRQPRAKEPATATAPAANATRATSIVSVSSESIEVSNLEKVCSGDNEVSAP
jgi:hypothetical protein